MKGIWKDSEVKALFGEVEKSVTRGKSLKNAFDAHAKRYKRASGSVRNYYYGEIERLKNDSERLERLNIDLSRHAKTSREYFSKEEENKFYQKVKCMVSSGMSVRKACLTLANDDGAKMLRYQNKFRALSRKKVEAKPDNIIRFTKRQTSITDAEIQALFAGLVRLVKRSAQEEADARAKEREERANGELRKMIVLLGEREREIERVKEDFASIKKENEKLLQGVRRQSCLKARVLNEKYKLSKKDNA